MTETTAATRVVGGVELPAPGTWALDPGHAEVGFVGRHFMLTKVRGRFTGVAGTVTVGTDPAGSRVSVVMDTTTLSSGDDARDAHLRSADFFDVERHPTATYESSEVRWDGTTGTMTGDLTIKGVRRPVTLAVEYVGYAYDPWDHHRAVFSARGTVNREDWGLTWNMPVARGGVLVSREIELVLEVELVLQ
ncbi:MAG TPA: YceI family protein [Mycobacteriales bacterium]|nr:YceI family protein [Mycobacteriales bacterium]